MLAVISPAKRLDFNRAAPAAKHSLPAFLPESKQLVDVLRQKSAAELGRLMRISSRLADLNHERFAQWQTPFTPDNARIAASAFRGDVYLGLDTDTLTTPDLNWAQKHLRILSGLYGLLKPLDLIQPYRLEMGTRLRNPRGADLYEYWRDPVTAALDELLRTQRRPVLVNLASAEYFEAVDTRKLNTRIITPVFKDLKNGRYRFLSFYAKKARGLMARYIIRNRISSPGALKKFDADGYYYSARDSRDDHWVFLRDRPR
ncbi:MAG: peroxide stress protein YaaA [Pseudomonadales bacterium]